MGCVAYIVICFSLDYKSMEFCLSVEEAFHFLFGLNMHLWLLLPFLKVGLSTLGFIVTSKCCAHYFLYVTINLCFACFWPFFFNFNFVFSRFYRHNVQYYK